VGRTCTTVINESTAVALPSRRRWAGRRSRRRALRSRQSRPRALPPRRLSPSLPAPAAAPLPGLAPTANAGRRLASSLPPSLSCTAPASSRPELASAPCLLVGQRWAGEIRFRQRTRKMRVREMARDRETSGRERPEQARWDISMQFYDWVPSYFT